MIARTWRGSTSLADGDRYLQYLRETGVAACRSTDGNRGVYVLRREADGRAEFLFVSLWDSLAAVRGFAGPDPERAVFFPEDDEFLIEREDTVRHFDVLVSP
jgi:heme-degrading monooxygenase HmoA